MQRLLTLVLFSAVFLTGCFTREPNRDDRDHPRQVEVHEVHHDGDRDHEHY